MTSQIAMTPRTPLLVHTAAADEEALSRTAPSLLATDALSYEDTLALIGTGRFHRQLLALCGWSNAADAVEIMSVSFLLPSATDDLDLSDNEKGWLAAIIFLGMLVGGLLWGTLSDRLGRKRCLIVALVLNSVGGFVSALSPTFTAIVACRFVAGIGVGGSIPVIFTYFVEFLPKSTRGEYMVYLAWFWMVGAITTAAAAWIIIPIDMSFQIGGMTGHSWRLFYMLCSVPSAACAVAMAFCPESPRFLIAMNRTAEAKSVLTDMFVINQCQRRSTLNALFGLCRRQNYSNAFRADANDNADEQDAADVRAGYADADAINGNAPSMPMAERSDKEVTALFVRRLKCLETALRADESNDAASALAPAPSIRSEVIAALNQSVQLFSTEHRRTSLMLGTVWFALSFGWYGITLWIPEFYQHINAGADTAAMNMYLAAFLSAASNLPGNVWSVYAVKSIGRAKTLAVSIGLSALAILFVPLATINVAALTCIITVFGAVSVGAWNALNISTTELYPTAIRSTAFGVFAAVGRFGAIFGQLAFGQFIGLSPAIPMIIVGTILVGGAIAALKLKETKDVVLQ